MAANWCTRGELAMKCDALHAENAELRAHLVQIAASVANIIKTQDGINVVHANKLDFLGNELQKLSSALLSMSDLPPQREQLTPYARMRSVPKHALR